MDLGVWLESEHEWELQVGLGGARLVLAGEVRETNLRNETGLCGKLVGDHLLDGVWVCNEGDVGREIL